MQSNTNIASNMEKIGTLFQDAQKYANTNTDFDLLIVHLDYIDSEFQSIAFEGASMELGLKSFILNDDMQSWDEYMNSNPKHQTQIFLGLGWAVSMNKQIPEYYLNQQNIYLQSKVWDGCGYFDGYFRKRQTLQSKQRVDYVTSINYQSYDHGLGRRIWYHVEGDINKASEIINGFPADRHSSLWRGIGMAATYVGGCGEETYKSLSEASKEYKNQLAIGAATIAHSRSRANLLTLETETAYNLWCNKTAQQAAEIVHSIEIKNPSSFAEFLLQLESNICNQ